MDFATIEHRLDDGVGRCTVFNESTGKACMAPTKFYFSTDQGQGCYICSENCFKLHCSNNNYDPQMTPQVTVGSPEVTEPQELLPEPISVITTDKAEMPSKQEEKSHVEVQVSVSSGDGNSNMLVLHTNEQDAASVPIPSPASSPTNSFIAPAFSF